MKIFFVSEAMLRAKEFIPANIPRKAIAIYPAVSTTNQHCCIRSRCPLLALLGNNDLSLIMHCIKKHY